MRYAIISDIHGNLEALNAVFYDIDRNYIDLVVCLGDIVGYYPNPEECVDIIRERVAYSVAGNHDFAAIGKIDTTRFTYYAHEAMEWTKKNLSDSSYDYLESLDLSIQIDGMIFTHSSPAVPENFTYIFPNSIVAIREAFSSMVSHIVFIGHTHVPFILVQDEPGLIQPILESEYTFKSESYYLVNVGSVGQPRNRVPMSSYAIFDTETKELSLKRVPYDIKITQEKTVEVGLPKFLAERLTSGR